MLMLSGLCEQLSLTVLEPVRVWLRFLLITCISPNMDDRSSSLALDGEAEWAVYGLTAGYLDVVDREMTFGVLGDDSRS